MSPLDALLAAVGVAPALPGARCRGRHHLFDELQRGEPVAVAGQRHLQAIGLCQACPSLNPCRAWFDGLKPSKRPTGVTAGRVNIPKPVGRLRQHHRKESE